jgi:hypothetical protein
MGGKGEVKVRMACVRCAMFGASAKLLDSEMFDDESDVVLRSSSTISIPSRSERRQHGRSYAVEGLRTCGMTRGNEDPGEEVRYSM